MDMNFKYNIKSKKGFVVENDIQEEKGANKEETEERKSGEHFPKCGQV